MWVPTRLSYVQTSFRFVLSFEPAAPFPCPAEPDTLLAGLAGVALADRVVVMSDGLVKSDTRNAERLGPGAIEW